MKTLLVFFFFLVVSFSCFCQVDCSNVYTPPNYGLVYVSSPPSCGAIQNFELYFQHLALNNDEHNYDWGIDVNNIIVPTGFTFLSLQAATSYYDNLINKTVYRFKLIFRAPATGGGTVKVRMYAKCTSTITNYGSYEELTITRPGMPVSIAGDNFICSGNKTYSFNTPASLYTSINWSSSSNSVAINGSNSQPSVSITPTGNGYTTLTASLTDVCSNSVTASKLIAIGTPDPYQITHEISGAATNVTLANTVNYMQANKWYRVKYNSSQSNITNYNWSATTYGYVDSYVNGNDYVFKLIPGSPSGDLRLKASATNGCGTSIERNISFVLSSSPYFVMSNPVSNGTLSIGFTNSDLPETLPDRIELIDEKTSKTVYTNSIASKNFENNTSRKLDIDTRNLKSGVYYLKVYPKNKEQEIGTDRILVQN